MILSALCLWVSICKKRVNCCAVIFRQNEFQINNGVNTIIFVEPCCKHVKSKLYAAGSLKDSATTATSTCAANYEINCNQRNL